MQAADRGLDLGHELDRRGSGADHRHLAAAEIVVVVPARGVKDAALEAVQPRELGDRRIGQGAGGGDDHLGGEVAGRGLDLPALAVVVPVGRQHLMPEAQVGRQVVAPGHLLDVGLDLGLAGEGAAPAGVLLVGERVQDAGDVAGAARVGVVAPGAAEVVGALEDHEVLDAVLLERDRHPDAGQPGAGDGDLDVSVRGV